MEWWTVLRLIDVLGGLSRAADLGFGLPPGEATRSAAIALLLGRSLDLPDQDVQAAAYAALLLHLGCISYSHETAEVFGNELVSNAAAARTNVADPRDVVRTYLPAVLRGHPPLTRIRLGLVTVTRGKRFSQQFETAACEVGRDAARRLRLAGAVQRSVYHSYERWNGGGVPAGLAGEEIPMGSRLAVASSVAALFDTVGGSEVAADGVRRQAGSILDPDIAGHLTRNAGDLLREVNSRDPHALVLELEPPPVTTVPESQLAEVATVFGDVVDLKTPFTHGHARGVAALARGAGERLGLPAAVVADLEVAALVHDLGRVAVPTAVWEKAGPLVAHEWEQVRLHAYHSERIVAGSERLAPLAAMASSAPPHPRW